MLHTKFPEKRPAGSREDFEGFLPYTGVAVILGHVTQMPRTKFCSPYPRKLEIKFGFDLASCFGEDVEIVYDRRRRRTERTTDGPLVSYKLTYEHLAQVS